MSEALWRRVHSFAAQKIKAAYLKRTGWDLKCPACNQWSCIADIELVERHLDGPDDVTYRCLGCNTPTRWQFYGPVAVPVIPSVKDTPNAR